MEKQKRNPQFAILSVMAIALVVMGHTAVGIGTLEWMFNYDSFHMPLFVFISGYFSSQCGKNKELNSLKETFKKAAKRLLIPFFIWNFLYGIFAVIVNRILGIEWCNANAFWDMVLIRPFTYGNVFFGFNSPSWFLLMLFEVKIIDSILEFLLRRVNYEDKISIIICLLAAIGSVYLSRHGERTAFEITVTRAGYMLFWFEAGGFYRRYVEKLDTCNNTLYFAVILTIQSVLMLICREKGIVAGIWNSEFTNGPFLTLLAAGTGIAFYLRLSRVLVPSFQNSNLVTYISTHTFSIMMHQMFGFFLLNIACLCLTKIMGSYDFDLAAFRYDCWYYYCPGNLYCFRVVYACFGFLIPLIGCKLYETYIQNRIEYMLNKVYLKCQKNSI